MVSEQLSVALYSSLPVPLQDAVCAVVGWREARTRFGPLFRGWLESLTESQWWSADEIEAYQDEQLRTLVRHAYENVPYYREQMLKLRLTPADIRGRADLPKLPILTKETVRRNGARLLAVNARKRDLVHRHTSGTTGSSLHFYSPRSALALQWAVWWRHRRRFGIDFGDLHANFTGKLVVPPRQNRPPYWRWNPAAQQVLFNMHHITPAKIEPIVEFLNARPFKFYSGYPSILHVLASTALDAGLRLEVEPRIVVTGAESVTLLQREAISRFTGAPVADQYGFSEGCGNASHCEHFVYHEDFEFGILECVDPVPEAEGRVRGRLVCTGFAAPEFPFIRYEVGDGAIWEDPDRPCACGRQSRAIVAIDGRHEEYVITPEGRRLKRFDYIFKDTHNVRESQILQERLGEIKVRVVRRPAYGERDERFIESEIARWISPELRVVFEYVEEIPREPNGKFLPVKSLLKTSEPRMGQA